MAVNRIKNVAKEIHFYGVKFIKRICFLYYIIRTIGCVGIFVYFLNYIYITH